MRCLIGLLLAASLTACGTGTGTADTANPELSHVTTADGVECLVYRGYQQGGISCNWERYNEDHK